MWTDIPTVSKMLLFMFSKFILILTLWVKSRFLQLRNDETEAQSHVTWLVRDLRSGTDNQEYGYKTCTSTTSKCWRYACNLVYIVIEVLQQIVMQIPLFHYYPIIILFLQRRKQFQWGLEEWFPKSTHHQNCITSFKKCWFKGSMPKYFYLMNLSWGIYNSLNLFRRF